MKKIAVVLGTARENNFSEKVAGVVNKFLETKDIETEYVDVSDYLFSNTISSEDEKVSKWKEIVESVDGMIFVSPEYNNSYPGELKILIDSLFNEYKGKTAGIVSVQQEDTGV